MKLPLPSPGLPRLRLTLLVATASFALLACASVPPPNAEIEASGVALASATGAGGTQWAPQDMRSAQDKLSRAKQALGNQDNALALNLARESSADSRLAEAKANAGKAGKSAAELQESSRVLREELQRKSTTKEPS